MVKLSKILKFFIDNWEYIYPLLQHLILKEKQKQISSQLKSFNNEKQKKIQPQPQP